MAKDLWTREDLESIRKMLYPRSVAVVGASGSNADGYGSRFLAAALRSADRLRVYAINPKYQDILGAPCFPSIAALPEVPDLVGIVVPQQDVLPTLRAAAAKGIKAAIVVSGGFAERGTEDGKELQEEMRRLARESGMRICGPNCLGVANVKDDIWVTATSRSPSGLSGHIGLVCQSGATAFGPFVSQAADNGFGFSHIITSGNEVDLEFADYARFLLDDKDTHVIGGFVEGFKDVRKLVAVAELAAERGKPIVLVKIGRSEQGARAAISHTASLTGSDAAYDALFRRHGIIRVKDYAELLQVAHWLVHDRKPRRHGVVVVSNSGGVSSLTADSLGSRGIELPALTERAHAGISAIVGNLGWVANPADVTNYSRSAHFPKILDFLIEEPEVGTLIVGSQAVGKAIFQAEQVIALKERTDKNVAYLWLNSRRDETGLALLKAAHIPVFYAPEDFARTLRHVIDYREWQRQRAEMTAPAVPALSRAQAEVAARLGSAREPSLSESDSKKVLAAWGVRTPAEMLSRSAAEAADAATKLGFPVVLKLDSPDVPHKTEADVVRLNLRSAEEVARAYEEIMANAARHAPGARVKGVSVQQMVSGGVEMIVGISMDPQIGPMLLLGAGGIMVEIFGDVSLRPCPVNRAVALQMIGELKAARLLCGFRGKPVMDSEALAQVLVDVSIMAVQLQDRLAEVDINPLMVLPRGQGVMAVDALVALRRDAVEEKTTKETET